ncbi:ergothioneine biosynthesis protein EgtC [Yinghuangia seranimata]|uniref:ergothioneine biosynthesis protein EgtC n=1 Tax=Yinghuangia seranimata TaxID=408067 RepID=UPI00248AE64B|nr:ergothioneine biosynthesis protein EgtC [Yinghuangia seranimata]MDI2125878.1 ergothioneine biosynthesis protein EgtC [Yinghuangia seranimata]
MCRHLAYLGDPASIASLVVEPPCGLYEQSWRPREQKFGTVNADGFGVGWYADGDPAPARYRRAVPIWADPSFADVARVTRTRALLAAVRSATAGTTQGEDAAAPYREGPWLFSHNGRLDAWPDGLGALAAALPPADLLRLESRCDSALLWALIRRLLLDGEPAARAVADVVTHAAAHTDGRFNVLLTDGHTITATAYGDTLYVRETPGGVRVASEPDAAGDWTPVPDRTLVTATREAVHLHPLTDRS